MKMRGRVVIAALVTITVIVLAFYVPYREYSQGVQQRQERVTTDYKIARTGYRQCLKTEHLWDAVHDVIAETGRPGGTGTALDRLVIPPGTQPQVIDILRQLGAGTPDTPADLTRFYKALGKRPTCVKPQALVSS